MAQEKGFSKKKKVVIVPVGANKVLAWTGGDTPRSLTGVGTSLGPPAIKQYGCGTYKGHPMARQTLIRGSRAG